MAATTTRCAQEAFKEGDRMRQEPESQDLESIPPSRLTRPIQRLYSRIDK